MSDQAKSLHASKGLNEALGLGVVIGIASAAHRADQTVVGKKLPVAAANYLTPSAISQQLTTLQNEAKLKLFELPPCQIDKRGLRLAAK